MVAKATLPTRRLCAAWSWFALLSGTVDANNYYCSVEIIGVYYEGECGTPCPSGYNDDCPDGQRCYGPVLNCKKAAASSKYCGVSKSHSQHRCDRECASDEECDRAERCWDTGNSCSVEVLMAEQRRDIPNPYNYYCGSSYVDADTRCDTDYYAIPCPPTTPGSDDGMLEGCPEDQYCYGNLQCNPVLVKPSEESDSIIVGSKPAPQPTVTEPPSVDHNPGDKYCSSDWRSAVYDGECGRPCPSGSDDECPRGEKCWGPQPLCTPQDQYAKIVGGSRWCGVDFMDMSSKCAKECSNGLDEECPEGEVCFNGSPCQFDQSGIPPLDPEMFWCGRSHMHLVENCPKRCRGGSNDECGTDEEGNEMSCFNMQSEEIPCTSVGVGVKEPTDPANLWCGSSWFQLLENCPKACPEGEGCGDDIFGKPMLCYDMSANGEVCQEEGKGIKERGDITKRFCGESFAHMMESCPERCMDGECPDGMQCFEDTPCVWVGKGVEVEEKDPDMMFCGNKFADAKSCSTACPSGSSDDCPWEQQCFSDVEGCKNSLGGKGGTSNNLLDLLNESEAKPLPKEEEKGSTNPWNDIMKPVPDPALEPEEAQPSENEQASLVEEPESSSNPPPTPALVGSDPVVPEESSSNPPPDAKTSSNPPPTPSMIALKPSADNGNPFEVLDSGPIRQGAVAKNLRIALYGLDEFSSNHVVEWERQTADYVEGVYNSLSANNAITSNAVNDVVAKFDITEVDLSSARRRRLRSQKTSAYLLTYTQTTRYTAEEYFQLSLVLQHPFSTPTKRDQYVKYLKAIKPELFGKLSSISVVFLPLNLATSFTILKDEESVSFEDAGTKFYSFYCHDSGIPCPMGQCLSNDSCVFLSDGRYPTPVAPYIDVTDVPLQPAPSTSAASSLVGLTLGGFLPSHSGPDPQTNGSKPAPPATKLESFNPPPTATAESKPAPLYNSGLTQPTPSATYDAPTSGNASNLSGPSQPNHSSISTIPISINSASDLLNSFNKFGPTLLTGLEMTLHGIHLVRAEHIFEWQYLTGVYGQNFYNNRNALSNDYVKNSVSKAANSIEILHVSFGVSPMPSTIVTFKQTSKYHSKDPKISISAVVMQPYLTSEYRDDYVNFLQRMLPNTFEALETISSIKMNSFPSPSILLIDTFSCGKEWPVDCSSRRRCENGADCPPGQECFTSLPGCTNNSVGQKQQQQQQQHQQSDAGYQKHQQSDAGYQKHQQSDADYQKHQQSDAGYSNTIKNPQPTLSNKESTPTSKPISELKIHLEQKQQQQQQQQQQQINTGHQQEKHQQQQQQHQPSNAGYHQQQTSDADHQQHQPSNAGYSNTIENPQQTLPNKQSIPVSKPISDPMVHVEQKQKQQQLQQINTSYHQEKQQQQQQQHQPSNAGYHQQQPSDVDYQQHQPSNAGYTIENPQHTLPNKQSIPVSKPISEPMVHVEQKQQQKQQQQQQINTGYQHHQPGNTDHLSIKNNPLSTLSNVDHIPAPKPIPEPATHVEQKQQYQPSNTGYSDSTPSPVPTTMSKIISEPMVHQQQPSSSEKSTQLYTIGSSPITRPSSEPVAQQEQQLSSSAQLNPLTVVEISTTNGGGTSKLTTPSSTELMDNVVKNAAQDVANTASTTAAAMTASVITTISTSSAIPDLGSVVQQQQPSADGYKSANSEGDELMLQQQQPPPLDHSNPTHLSNIGGSAGVPHSMPLNIGPRPANQPVSAPISQQLKPFTKQESLDSAHSTTSESDIPCNLCKQGQVSQSVVVSFNGKKIDCLEAYNVMVDNFKERSLSCVNAQSTISKSCCFESLEEVDASISESGLGASYLAPSSLSKPIGQQPASGEFSTNSDESPSNLEGTQPEETYVTESYISTGAGTGNGPDGTDPKWFIHWDNSSPPARTLIPFVFASVVSFSLWLSWV